MLRIHVVPLIAMAGLFSGCASTEQVGDVQGLVLMNDSHTVAQTNHECRESHAYRHQTINWSAYNKVLLQPVTIREGLLSKLRHQEHHDLLLLAGSLEDTLHLKLSKDYEIVERPMAGTMLIQVAITQLEDCSTAPAIWATVAQALQAVATIYTLAGKPPFAAEVMAEFTIRDAQTGELLVAEFIRRISRQDRFDREVLNSWGTIKNSLECWADLSAYRLCVLRGVSDCVEPHVYSVNQVQRMS